jgi:hypothetical protein
MQRRIAALVAAAVAVLGAVVVLVVRVKAEPDVAVSDQALREAQASFERASRAPAPPSTPAIPPPTLRSPEPEAAEPAARVGESERRIPRVPPTMASGLRREGRDRGESEVPSDAPTDQSPELVQKRNTVTEAYDHGDFEAAFRASEDFLHQQPDDAYVKRVAAVSACALGDQSAAMKHYQEATEANKRIIKLRCHRYGIEL